MPSQEFSVGKIDRDNIDLDTLDCAVDTAGSWDGDFPDPDEGDYLVTIGAWDRDEETVLVSRRYTSAVDAKDAASLALDAFAERHDYERDDNGDILPIEVEGETGIPVWVVSVDKVVAIEKCRYEDCVRGNPIADDDEQVTCPDCRDYMGLPPIERD